jgi:hypothetical protein
MSWVFWKNKKLSNPAFRRVGYAVLTVMFVASEFAGWPPSLAPQLKEARAINCGFGSDIGGGRCRGFITDTAQTTWSVPSDWNGQAAFSV